MAEKGARAFLRTANKQDGELRQQQRQQQLQTQGQTLEVTGAAGATSEGAGNRTAETRVGVRYARWGAQMSGGLALSNGIDPGPDARCTIRVAKRKAVYKARKACVRPGLILPADTVSFTWAGAETCLRSLQHFHGTGRGAMQQAAAVKWLQDRVLTRLRELWLPRRVKEWVPGRRPKTRRVPRDVGAKPADTSSSEDEGGEDLAEHTVWRCIEATSMELAAWRFFIKYPAAAEKSDWTRMAAEASRMSAVGKKKARAQAKRDVAKWAEQCLAGAASKGHGFVKPRVTVLDMTRQWTASARPPGPQTPTKPSPGSACRGRISGRAMGVSLMGSEPG